MIPIVLDGVCALQTQSVNAGVSQVNVYKSATSVYQKVAGDVCNFIHARPAIRDTHYFLFVWPWKKGCLTAAIAFTVAVAVHRAVKRIILTWDVALRGIARRHVLYSSYF